MSNVDLDSGFDDSKQRVGLIESSSPGVIPWYRRPTAAVLRVVTKERGTDPYARQVTT